MLTTFFLTVIAAITGTENIRKEQKLSIYFYCPNGILLVTDPLERGSTAWLLKFHNTIALGHLTRRPRIYIPKQKARSCI